MRQEQPTFAASLHSADSRASSTYANSLRLHAYASRHTTLHTTSNRRRSITGQGSSTLTASSSKGHVWRSKSGILFTTTQGELPTEAILRATWTRNMRMLVEWRKSTRHLSSKKVLRPRLILNSSEVHLAVWKADNEPSPSLQPKSGLATEMQSRM